MKLGLKLWSINTDYYLNEAIALYNQGWYEYIELYVVPDTLNTIQKWKSTNIPFTLHAPHFLHGINLAKKEFEKTNIKFFDEVKVFSNELNAEYVVIHSGTDGNIEETIRQLKIINIENMLIENKPYKAIPNKMNGKFCTGTTIKEISQVINELDCGFCLDIGHAICSANTLKKEPYAFLKEFNDLNPNCYHLSDNFIDAEFDTHLHFGDGSYDLKKIIEIMDINKNIAIETDKDSKKNLNDFINDIKFLKGVIKNSATTKIS